MASQAEKYRKVVQEYEALPTADAAVLSAMRRRLNYANTIDPQVDNRASKLLESAK